jgi:hypothetical protein
MNITLQDCIAMCGLEDDEVAAIAEHEHIPEIAAAALANYLLHKKGGPSEIKQMLVDDFRAVMKRHDKVHAAELLAALRHFTAAHRDELLAEQRRGQGAA